MATGTRTVCCCEDRKIEIKNFVYLDVIECCRIAVLYIACACCCAVLFQHLVLVDQHLRVSILSCKHFKWLELQILCRNRAKSDVWSTVLTYSVYFILFTIGLCNIKDCFQKQFFIQDLYTEHLCCLNYTYGCDNNTWLW